MPCWPSGKYLSWTPGRSELRALPRALTGVDWVFLLADFRDKVHVVGQELRPLVSACEDEFEVVGLGRNKLNTSSGSTRPRFAA